MLALNEKNRSRRTPGFRLWWMAVIRMGNIRGGTGLKERNVRSVLETFEFKVI